MLFAFFAPFLGLAWLKWVFFYPRWEKGVLGEDTPRRVGPQGAFFDESNGPRTAIWGLVCYFTWRVGDYFFLQFNPIYLRIFLQFFWVFALVLPSLALPPTAMLPHQRRGSAGLDPAAAPRPERPRKGPQNPFFFSMFFLLFFIYFFVSRLVKGVCKKLLKRTPPHWCVWGDKAASNRRAPKLPPPRAGFPSKPVTPSEKKRFPIFLG